MLSAMRIVPILRATLADRVCLCTIQWLHQTLVETEKYPATFLNGNIAIRPFVGSVPLYIFPSLEQRGLLYQPLLFHEFGHLLYALHRPEMDDLVRELQYAVDDALMPLSQRNDRYTDAETADRQIIMNTWYAWAQELFCDAVGFTIGGPCYLHAFSNYLGMRDQGGYYRQRERLEHSSHPVSWLRIHFLTHRAKSAGFSQLATLVETKWKTIAHIMKITEDYHGYYDAALDRIIQSTLSDMLVEAAPQPFSQPEIKGESWNPDVNSPVQLFNWAWQAYENDPDSYAKWEVERMNEWVR